VLLLVFEKFEIELTLRKFVVDGRLWLSLALLLNNTSAVHLSILFVESCEVVTSDNLRYLYDLMATFLAEIC
jgi:hypothetical protein